MEKKLLKKIATPLLKKIGKNFTTKVYEGFIDYLKRNNFETTVVNEKFEIYFEEFCLWYFENSKGERLDFQEKIKIEILKRSGGCCAICGTLTLFPQESENNKSLVIAAACHIKPASKYGPRADPNSIIDIKEISSIDNGLWACMNCHKDIDTECKKYTIEYLKELRNKHEQAILNIKKSRPDIRQIIEALELRDNSNYAYIPLKELEDNMSLKNKLLSTHEKMQELYSQLKDLEKNAIEELSIFRMIKELNSKKEAIFGKGSLGLKISDDEFIMQVCVKNMDNIQSKLDEYAKQFKKEFNYEVMHSGYATYNKKYDMVMSISDLSKEFEFFIINANEKNIIKMKNHDFKAYPIRNEFNYPSIVVIKENTVLNSLIKIELTRDGDITHAIISTSKNDGHSTPDILDFYREFLFIEYIEGFDLCNFSFLVRHKEIIFEYTTELVK